MRMSHRKHLPASLAPRLLVAALLLCAQPLDGRPAEPEVPLAVASEEASEAMAKASAKMDKTDYAGAVADLEAMLRTAKPDSYDIYVVNLMVAQCHLLANNYAAAVAPLERAIDTGYVEAQEEKYMLLLSQIYFQLEQYDKAEQRLRTLLMNVQRPGSDALFLYATTLYQLNRFNEALVQARRSLRSQLDVRDEQLQLVIACAQQVANFPEALGYLETLVARHPDKANNWAQLAGTYASANNPLGALLAIERAQEHGFMKRQADNLARVQLLYNMEQFDRAAEILDRGLSDGSIENTQGNWELLAHCYKQRFEMDKVRGVLERASATTAWGALDLQLAEMNWMARRYKETVADIESAKRKGISERSGDVHLLLASALFELGEFARARDALAEAAVYPELKTKVDSLRRAIDDSEARRLIKEEDQAGQPAPMS